MGSDVSEKIGCVYIFDSAFWTVAGTFPSTRRKSGVDRRCEYGRRPTSNHYGKRSCFSLFSTCFEQLTNSDFTLALTDVA